MAKVDLWLINRSFLAEVLTVNGKYVFCSANISSCLKLDYRLNLYLTERYLGYWELCIVRIDEWSEVAKAKKNNNFNKLHPKYIKTISKFSKINQTIEFIFYLLKNSYINSNQFFRSISTFFILILKRKFQ